MLMSILTNSTQKYWNMVTEDKHYYKMQIISLAHAFVWPADLDLIISNERVEFVFEHALVANHFLRKEIQQSKFSK